MNEYGNCLNWFEYGQLRTAIPNEWKTKMINDSDNAHCCMLFDRIKNEGKISKLVYDILIQKENCLMSKVTKWENKLNINIEYNQFVKFVRNIYLQSICTKYRDFQYRLVTMALVTNRKLFLWGVIETQNCTLCGKGIEDEIHLFYSCPRAQEMWNSLKDYIQDNDVNGSAVELVWNCKNIIFSAVHSRADHIVNFLVTIAKRYIYVCRCMNDRPWFGNLAQEIENTYIIETNIAKRKLKSRKNAIKWSPIKNTEDEDQNFIEDYIHNM